MKISDAEYRLLRQALVDAAAIDVPSEKRYLFETRLEPVLRAYRCSSFGDLHRLVTRDPQGPAAQAFLDAMTTHETAFFRDRHPFVTLREKILPAMFEQRRGSSSPLARAPARLRLLSAGCSTGQEAFSLAITVNEWRRAHPSRRSLDIQVVGLDLSATALDQAHRALYPHEMVESQVETSLRERWFESTPLGYRPIREIRSMVRFVRGNLRDPIVAQSFFQIVFCRNVLIYFAPEHRRLALERLHHVIEPGGVLCLGASESLYGEKHKFRMLRLGPSIYYRRDE